MAHSVTHTTPADGTFSSSGATAWDEAHTVTIDADAIDDSATTNKFTTASDISKLAGIESSADVTDATNVDAAGAVMESDYNANTVLAATSDNTPTALTVGEQTVVGRITSGNIAALTQSQLRTLIGGSTTIVAPTSFPSANELTISSIPQTFVAYSLVITGLSFDTASRNLNIIIPSITSNYSGIINDASGNSAVTIILAGGTPPQTAAQTCTGHYWFTGLQAGLYPTCIYSVTDTSPTHRSGQISYFGDTNAVTSLTLKMNNTGNFDAGTYALHGLN